MIRILDLFAGTQSVRKMLDDKYQIENWEMKFHNGYVPIWSGFKINKKQDKYEKIVEYIGIDIESPEDLNFIFDLTAINIVQKLNKFLNGWKPDFIWASPLCTPFSRATSIKNGTLSYEVIDGNLKIREDFSYITHKAYVDHINNPDFIKKHQEKGKLGLKLFNNTKKIINSFNCPFVIENPASAISKYILKEFIKNDTTYCMYGFDYKKRTSIYSNKKLDLLICNHKGNHKMVMSGRPNQTGIKAAPSSNRARSIVPPKLIKQIFEELL